MTERQLGRFFQRVERSGLFLPPDVLGNIRNLRSERAALLAALQEIGGALTITKARNIASAAIKSAKKTNRLAKEPQE